MRTAGKCGVRDVHSAVDDPHRHVPSIEIVILQPLEVRARWPVRRVREAGENQAGHFVLGDGGLEGLDRQDLRKLQQRGLPVGVDSRPHAEPIRIERIIAVSLEDSDSGHCVELRENPGPRFRRRGNDNDDELSSLADQQDAPLEIGGELGHAPDCRRARARDDCRLRLPEPGEASVAQITVLGLVAENSYPELAEPGQPAAVRLADELDVGGNGGVVLRLRCRRSTRDEALPGVVDLRSGSADVQAGSDRYLAGAARLGNRGIGQDELRPIEIAVQHTSARVAPDERVCSDQYSA